MGSAPPRGWPTYVLAGQEERCGGQALERWLTDLVRGPLPGGSGPLCCSGGVG